MSGEIGLGATDVLVVVDLQNDFCPGGALPVPGGDEIVPLVNRIAAGFDHVLLTQDWHPPGHQSFASAHPGGKPFDVVRMAYGEQVLWPDHCVQDGWGAAFHPGLDIPHAELVLRKGYRPDVNSYSAFFENDRRTPTGLAGYLRERGLTRVFLAGLAFDFCVLWSAEDARRLGFAPVVLDDACRSLDVQGSAAAARSRLQAIGAPCAPSAALIPIKAAAGGSRSG